MRTRITHTQYVNDLVSRRALTNFLEKHPDESLIRHELDRIVARIELYEEQQRQIQKDTVS